MNLEGTFINEETGEKLIFEIIDFENYSLTWIQKDGTIHGPEKIHLSLGQNSYHVTGGKLLDNSLIQIDQNLVLNNQVVYKRVIMVD